MIGRPGGNFVSRLSARAANSGVGVRRSRLANASEVKSTLFDDGGELKLGRRHRPDYFLIILIAILALTGLVVLFSIAPALTDGDGGEQTKFMIRQATFLFIGIAAFFVASRIPLDFWRSKAIWIMIAAFGLCLLLPIMGALHIPPALCANGACRWYSIGDIASFQPAEFMKFGMLIWTSVFLAVRFARGEIASWRRTMLPLAAVLLVELVVIVIFQKDLGTGVALVAITLAQLIIARVPWRMIGAAVLAIIGAGVLSILVAPHRMERIMTFFGRADTGDDYHINQALIALGSGGFSGRGLGQSVQAFGWLPEAVNDSIFAIIGESVGFIGLVGILVVFFILLRRILREVDFQENSFLRFVVAGVFGWLAAHLVINVGAMIGLLPLTGITLPLLSFGGTSMAFIMLSLGVVFAISRYSSHRKVTNEMEVDDENSLRRRGIRRTRYAGRRGY